MGYIQIPSGAGEGFEGPTGPPPLPNIPLGSYLHPGASSRPVAFVGPSGPPTLGTYPTQVKEIPDGYKGTAATIKEMKKLSQAASLDPKFVMWCRSIVADLPSKDYYGEANRIYDVVKRHVRYVLDPRGMEFVQDPRYVLFVDGSGDCDEHASTIAAIALCLGHEASFKTIAADASRPDEFSHVYAMIGIQKGPNTEWWACDTTQRSGHFGWEPPARMVKRTETWPVG